MRNDTRPIVPCPFDEVKITASVTIEKAGEKPVTISKGEIFDGESARSFLIQLKGYLRTEIFGILRELGMADYYEKIGW